MAHARWTTSGFPCALAPGVVPGRLTGHERSQGTSASPTLGFSPWMPRLFRGSGGNAFPGFSHLFFVA